MENGAGVPPRPLTPSFSPGLTVTIVPVILPLQRLQVIQLISPTLAQRAPVRDYPAKSAVGVSIALSPNEGSMCIQSHRRMPGAGLGLVPNCFDDCCVKGLT